MTNIGKNILRTNMKLEIKLKGGKINFSIFMFGGSPMSLSLLTSVVVLKPTKSLIKALLDHVY